MTTVKPFVFLDVDGVLNCTPQPLFNQIMESVDWRDVTATTQWQTYKIWFQESVVKRLNDLHVTGQIEIVWLTTWVQDAQSEIAPRLGLDHFEVLPKTMGDYMPSSDWWKIHALQEKIGEDARPFVWLDDQINSTVRRVMNGLALPPHELITVPSNPGLTHELLDALNETLELFA